METRTETRVETLEPLSETPLETQETPSEAQAIEGYACSCGFATPNLNEFKGHQMSTWRDRENHQSLGRVNFDTGEVIMPPAKDRTKEQWALAKYGEKPESSTPSPQKGLKPQTQTQHMQQAMEIRLVQRSYTIDYSPTLRIAQIASMRLWGWPDLPLGDFIDTIVYRYFKRCGVSLAGFIVDETEEEKQRREKMVAEFQKGGNDGSS